MESMTCLLPHCLITRRSSTTLPPLTAVSKEKPKEAMKVENDHTSLKVAGQDGSVVQIKRHTPWAS